MVLAESLIAIDEHLDGSPIGSLDFLVTRVGESGSRDLLGAIAGSMLTVASTTFSITIAVLALSSSTYGPRLVRNFMADRGNQFVLGIFVATFLYSLMVLRSIRVIGANDGDYFVPHVAVNVAVLFAVLSIGVLVYFIHHISESVQVWTLAEQVRVDLLGVVNRLYPEVPEHKAHAPACAVSEQLESQGAALVSLKTGYVQAVDYERLLTLAHEHDVVISMKVRPGTYVTAGTHIAVVWPPHPMSDGIRRTACRAVRVGRAREPLEDVEFPALLLEELAVRALSPGTNDPYTAINALDNLASGLVALAGRPLPSACRHDPDGKLRIVAPPASLADVTGHLLDAMRYYAVGHPTVLHRTLELLAQLGENCSDVATRRMMAAHAQRLVDAFASTSPLDIDLNAMSDHSDRVREQLLGPNAS